ncbi:hypothetical protein OAK02_04035 [Candidatus Nitrosopelagicus sp.]|nr:hypothetical protein [Candidatus Nitrosopelagicus sp.]
MTESDAPSGKPQSYTRKTLGDSEDKPKAPEIYKCCDNPQITYLAPVNINIDERTIGSVDVWRCAACMKAFCEEKTLGIDSISDIVGMPRIDDNEKWAVIVSKLQKGKDKWKLVKLQETGMIKFETSDENSLT